MPSRVLANMIVISIKGDNSKILLDHRFIILEETYFDSGTNRHNSAY